ncbi:ATP-grasp fold amidoligase family protein [uncultured Eudoraea sp.]|uniref:ATP-grasp fold amidoligase family protein n=1 Tax=uncultured Eudoraea sp. TaxID=1035614 RepID=UPI00260B04C9|nr:ATP-grasp fold amidoligase family protein [uncultured Eudoraea sp.]
MINFRNLFKYYYHNTRLGKVLIYPYMFYRDYIMSDVTYIKKSFKRVMGYNVNLKDPITLNEKIQWLKLNDKTALHTQCADKYAVREYVASKIGQEYLVPLYFTTKDPAQIVPDNLPQTPYIIKTNHDSSGGIIIQNVHDVNWKEIQKTLKRRMSKNYYYYSKERQYKNIIPRIIVEKLLEDKNGNIPFDYKVHCFNGKVRMISVDMWRGTNDHHRNWYSTDWQREPYKWSSPKGPGKFTDPSEIDIEKPKSLEDMIKLSEILAESFLYVRVDWYDVDDTLYFGELTFHHDSGFQPILPKIWDEKLGKELILTR